MTLKNLTVADVRPALSAFVLVMEQKLRDNDHKTEATLMPSNLLLRRLQAEVLELEVALGCETDKQIQREAADVANFALMLFARHAKMTITRDISEDETAILSAVKESIAP